MQDDAQNIIGLYRRHADVWARLREPLWSGGDWFKAFLDLQPKSPSILDIGCGSGQPIGRYLLDQGAAVTGIDTSPELIDIARDRVGQGAWLVADMRKLDLQRTFTGLLAWHSSFHLTPDDQRTLFPIFQKHAAPNAALMFTTGTRHSVAIGEFQGEPLYHASLDPEEYRSLLDAHGFELVSHWIEGPDSGPHMVWLARFLGAHVSD